MKLPRPGNAVQEEIEAFLRRAAGQEPRKPDVVAAEVVPAPPAGARQRQAPAARQKPEAADRESRESVAEHVARRMHQGGLENRDADLGGTIQQTDRRMGSRLEGVFDHQVGQLGSASPPGSAEATQPSAGAPVAAAPDTPSMVAGSVSASRIAQMLRSPQDIAAAIVLSEILRRPVERWS